MNTVRRWLIMTILCVSGGVIYLLPFMREVYYLPLQTALGLTNTQFGTLMTAFGAASMLVYGPGGWLADRLSPRVLISFSLVSTGAVGFWFASFPSYEVALAIHAVWGVTVTGAYWGAMIKATRAWAPSEAQGRAFGILEGGRGATEALATSGFLALFAFLGGAQSSLAQIIVVYSVLNIALGIIAWFAIDPQMGDPHGQKAPGLGEFLNVLKMPSVWLIGIVVMTGYAAYWGSFYFTPYATDVLLLSVVIGGAIGAGKNWLRPLAAGTAGVIADKAGVARTVAVCFCVLIVTFMLLAYLPQQGGAIALGVALMIIGFLGIFAIRGIYFALIDEARIPMAVTGSAAGVLSIIGFTPDIFMPIIGGLFLDNAPGPEGYRNFFVFIAALCAVGLFASIAIDRKGRRRLKPVGRVAEPAP